MSAFKAADMHIIYANSLLVVNGAAKERGVVCLRTGRLLPMPRTTPTGTADAAPVMPVFGVRK